MMNTPKWIHTSISPSTFSPTCAYTLTILHLLHTLFWNPKTPPHHHSSLLKCLKTNKKNEEEKKEEQGQKKERNKKLQEGK